MRWSPLGWIAAASLAHGLSRLRLLDELPLPREGGLARVAALAVSRAPELFVLLGALALAAWVTALVAIGWRRALGAAGWLGATLYVASAAAVLSVLPPPLDTTGFFDAGEHLAYAQPHAIYGLAVSALAVHVVLLGAARLRAVAREHGALALAWDPSVAAMVTWAAVAASVGSMWYAWGESAPGISPEACSTTLAGTALVALAQAGAGAWIHARRGRARS